MTYELGLVGGGNMGAALMSGILSSGTLSPADVVIVESSSVRRSELQAMFDGVTVTDEIPSCRSVVIAVKPPDVAAVVARAVEAGARRVLSVAAGVTVAVLEAAAGDGVAVIRTMPNTPALVGSGVSAIAGGTSATDDDLRWADGVLAGVGIVERVVESQLDAVTGLTGSGPAYVFLVAEALIEAGVAEGLSRPTAERMVTQLLVGSAALLEREGDPGRLRAMVTSPGGTTAAGLGALEERAVRAAFAAAVRASADRSARLGG